LFAPPAPICHKTSKITSLPETHLFRFHFKTTFILSGTSTLKSAPVAKEYSASVVPTQKAKQFIAPFVQVCESVHKTIFQGSI
jgi:hypothetical protein